MPLDAYPSPKPPTDLPEEPEKQTGVSKVGQGAGGLGGSGKR
jgi:hypothetical protein